MIIDAHHHLWKYNAIDYSWMDDSMSALKKDYLPVDIENQLLPAKVSGTVVIQARQNLEETRWLLEQAGKHKFIKGVVGWVDLLSDGLRQELNEFSENPAMVGVRHVIHDEADDAFMLRSSFLKGIETLQDFGLAYDLLLFPKHLEMAVELAGMFPDQNFVLDHMGKPFIKTGIMDPWRNDILALAALPNVWCKISGMLTEADVDNWRYEDLIPYLETVMGAFGTDRLMLGSDWPVCRLAGEYQEVMDIPVRFLRDLEPCDKERIYRSNCINILDITLLQL